MQARVCVQNYDNGDVQGFLYIDVGAGESLTTTSPRYANGTSSANLFTISGTQGTFPPVQVSAAVDIGSSQIMFTVTVGSLTPSMFTETLVVSSASC